METKLLRWKKVSFKTLLKNGDRRRKPNVKREWVPVAGGSNTESIVTTLSMGPWNIKKALFCRTQVLKSWQLPPVKTLTTCYWFGINTIYAQIISLVKSSGFGMLSYNLKWLARIKAKRDKGQSCVSLLSSSSMDYWSVYVCKSDKSAGWLRILFAVTSHI